MKVVLITGLARSGKDESAKLLKTMLEDDGKSVVIMHYADLLKYIVKEYFGWNGEKDTYGRSLLQYVGTDIVRKKDENFWINFIESMLNFFGDEWEYVIIPDVRFDNEYTKILDDGFDTVLLKVVRDVDNGLTEEQTKHSSEQGVNPKYVDFVIDNNGTIEDLRDNLSKFIKEYVYGQKRS